MTRPFLVFRDSIGVPSEIGFLRRQYIAFTRLRPVWIGRTLLPSAAQVGDCLRIGNPVSRLLFRHFGFAPAIQVPDLAPVLHAQFARGGALALPIATALGSHLFVTLHGGDVSKGKNWQGTLLARRWPDLIRATTRFICVSTAVAEVAAARGVPQDKLVVLPIGVEVPAEPPPRAPETYLFVGRFVEKKGITVLAEAIRHLRAQGDLTPLVCVGDGPLRTVLEDLARDVPGITLPGWLPSPAVQAHMAQAKALVVPSIIAADGDAEGLPSVIPEAMAAGCPVIGSGQGGIAEAIQDRETGLLVPPGNAAALAASMLRLAANEAENKRLGLAGFGEAAANLNAKRQSAKLEALLLGA